MDASTSAAHLAKTTVDESYVVPLPMGFYKVFSTEQVEISHCNVVSHRFPMASLCGAVGLCEVVPVQSPISLGEAPPTLATPDQLASLPVIHLTNPCVDSRAWVYFLVSVLVVIVELNVRVCLPPQTGE